MDISMGKLIGLVKKLGGGQGAGGGGAQPDWNQNDETAPDYVKNRTHYVSEKKVDIIAYEHTFKNNGNPVSDVTMSNGAPPYFLVEDFKGFSLGGTYIVIWDDTKYECVAREMTNNGYTYVGIGNAKLWTNVSTDETYEPFLFCADEYSTTAYTPIGGEFGYKEKHSFAVSTMEDEYHPMDDGYIPNSIARKEESAYGAVLTLDGDIGSDAFGRFASGHFEALKDSLFNSKPVSVKMMCKNVSNAELTMYDYYTASKISLEVWEGQYPDGIYAVFTDGTNKWRYEIRDDAYVVYRPEKS